MRIPVYRDAWKRYAFAAVLTAAAVVLRVFLSHLGLRGFPFITFFPAVILTALFSGPGPAIFGIAASTIAGTALLPEGLGAPVIVSHRLADYARFVAACIPVIWLGEWVRRSQRRANDEAVTRARLAAIVRSSEDAIVSKDLVGIIQSWNDAATSLFGYAADEAVGKSIGLLIPPERADEEKSILKRVRRGERIEHFETVRLRKDGIRIDVSVTVSPVRDGRGVVVGASKIARGIGEQKARDARHQFLARLNDAIRPLSDPGEVTWSVVGTLASHFGVSRCAFAEVGEAGVLVVGRDCCRGVASAEGSHPIDELGLQLIAELEAGRTVVLEDVVADPRSAGDVAARLAMREIGSAVYVPLVRKNQLGALLMLHDQQPRNWPVDDVVLLEQVTERLWMVLENARAQAAVLSSEERLRLGLEAGNIGTWDWDLVTGRITWSEQMRRFYGLEDTEFVGKLGDALARVVPEDADLVVAAVRRSIEHGVPYQIEFRVRQPAGGFRWLAATGRVHFDRDGRAVRMLGTTRDLTDTKRLERERESLLESERAARAEAERAGRLKDEFLATLSHELRTPLNAILGYAQLLRGLAHDPAEIAEGLEVIERNARIQTQIIADLLDMSRIIAGKLLLEVEDVPLASVVCGAVETVRPSAAAKSIELELPPRSAGGIVRGDGGRLQQVVWNLLTNAIKFTPVGGRVRIGLVRNGELFELSVSDTGQGIAPDFVPFVFDRFRQADATTTRRHGGLGLGLSIVKHIVELHQGTVEVGSDGDGRGATFVVRLPVAPALPDSPASPKGEDASAPTGPHGPEPELGGLRVLVVDDERDARELVRRVLTVHGAEVNLAASVTEAVEQLAAGPHDVLLSDIGMPERDGYELIRLVRARRADEGGGIPAAAVTAFARPEDRFLAMRAGYQSHIPKPIEARVLVATVAHLAGRVGPDGAG